MRFITPLLFCCSAFTLQAQSVLHFTRTSGYDHNTRNQSFALFTGVGDEIGATVVDDATGDQFSDLSTLLQFDVILFSNTSGDAILDATQRSNFEAYIANGGSVLGIHAASDTYRHSTANGNNTGTWDFYPELIGASVQENPNHVAGTPEYAMHPIGIHASTANVPDPWVKNEEYYYWENGYFGTDNTVVLEVEETVGPNGQVNPYDAPRAMSWYRTLPTGGRMFYTALGHAPSSFESDPLFRTHMKDALVWLLDGPTSIGAANGNGTQLFPNPAQDLLHLTSSAAHANTPIVIHDARGRVVHHAHLTGSAMTLNFHLPNGCYTVRLGNASPLQLIVLN